MRCMRTCGPANSEPSPRRDAFRAAGGAGGKPGEDGGPVRSRAGQREGMRHLEILDERFGRARVLGGQCAIAATLNEKHEIVHLNKSHSLSFGERHDPARHVGEVGVPGCAGRQHVPDARGRGRHLRSAGRRGLPAKRVISRWYPPSAHRARFAAQCLYAARSPGPTAGRPFDPPPCLHAPEGVRSAARAIGTRRLN